MLFVSGIAFHKTFICDGLWYCVIKFKEQCA
jgi:hypothetical protein